jgi:anti-sigma regulatory factor (Ser/Thr protein kinase)
MNNYQVPANVELIDKMIDPIISSLEEIEVEHKKVYQVTLALEEIFANISKYAYPSGEGIIDIFYEINKDKKQLKVVIKDKGAAFNPLEKEDPDLGASVSERKIGGLGIYIVKNIIDDIKYQRINNENVLELIKQL